MQTRARIRSAVEQWIAAMAPSNYLAFNAGRRRDTIETQGRETLPGAGQPAA